MKVKIVGKYRDNVQSREMHELLGVKRLPDEGMSVREIQGVQVYVLPRAPKNGRKSSRHRVMAICNCGRIVPVGRLHQHKCEAGTK